MLLKKSEGGFGEQYRNQSRALCASIVRAAEASCIILAEIRRARRRGRLFQQYRSIAVISFGLVPSGWNGVGKRTLIAQSEGVVGIASNKIFHLAQSLRKGLYLAPPRMIDKAETGIPKRSNFGPLFVI